MVQKSVLFHFILCREKEETNVKHCPCNSKEEHFSKDLNQGTWDEPPYNKVQFKCKMFNRH